MMTGTSVYKFGGGCFLGLSDYRVVADFLIRCIRETSERFVVVVSAMSGTTGTIKNALEAISRDAPPETYDAALATGEALSVAFLRAALSRAGLRATSLSSHNLGLVTDSRFGSATVKIADMSPIRSALQNHEVVAVPGGQAVNEHGQVTMLGRNSSDLTAILLASGLGCEVCTIFSDVSGVYSADPYVVPEATVLRAISFERMHAIAVSGAKVLHHRAIRLASERGIKILCRSLDGGSDAGTTVGDFADPPVIVTCRDAALVRGIGEDERNALLSELASSEIACVAPQPGASHDAAILMDQEWALVRLKSRLGKASFDVSRAACVSVLADGDVERAWFDDEADANEEARRAHHRLYPSQANKGPIKQKRRSAYSNILAPHG